MVNLLDCTLRDGGYYNSWDFEVDLIPAYIKAIGALPVDMVEIGFRNMPGVTGKFMSGFAFCSDDFIRSLSLKLNNSLSLAVMVNGADLIKYHEGVPQAVNLLFGPEEESPVKMVRIACHIHQVEKALPAINRLNELGYKTTVNLMQIAGLTRNEMESISKTCSAYPIDVLYFADSLGSMGQDDINFSVDALRTHWKGEIGFHAHNNMERALANCIRAIEQGVTWIDSTVLGMGRGPGNCRTEYLSLELEAKLKRKVNITPLLDLVYKYFKPMQQKFGWGPNPYYYMAGKHGIHPTYIQEMIGDSRYNGEDILAVIDHLSTTGGKNFSLDALEAARNFYTGEPRGLWKPQTLLENREVLLLGAGPSVVAHKNALAKYIKESKPVVIALNTQADLDSDFIDIRVACHPIRLLADHEDHLNFSQPLITPYTMLPDEVKKTLQNKTVLDFGLGVKSDTFNFFDTHCNIPTSLVVPYALAIATSGKAKKVLLAGFDGYGVDDPRTQEMQDLFNLYFETDSHLEVISVTPTRYNLVIQSIYSM